ncbi:MAG TPA: hypothetical protein VGI19_00890 [Candidatus Cybelea sp.]
MATASGNIVYVAESLGHAIDAYEVIGGTAKLVRRLTFGSGINDPQPEYLATDAEGYLYASMDNVWIDVFKPGESGRVRKQHSLLEAGKGGALQIGTDGYRDVYQPNGDHLYVHLSHDDKLPRRNARTVLTDGEPGAWLTRAEGNEVFIGPAGLAESWYSMNVIPTHTWGHVKPVRSLVLMDGCWGHIQDAGLSVTLANGYLYETCGYIDRSHKYVRGIWTYRADGSGAVKPLGFAGTNAWQPGDIAVGP